MGTRFDQYKAVILEGTPGKRTLLLHHIVASARVVDHNGLDIVIGLVVGIEHCVCNVRNVVARVALASNVDLLVVQTKGVDKVLEKAEELCRNGRLIGCVGSALGETSPDGLLDPDHAGQIDPGVWVLYRQESACVVQSVSDAKHLPAFQMRHTILPLNRAVFLKEALETGTSRSTIQPDCDFIAVDLSLV